MVLVDDLKRLGMTPKQVRRTLASEQLVRVHRGVHRLAGSPRSWEQELLAACLASGGVASHRSAARLWAVRLTGVDRRDWPVEVAVHRPNAPRLKGVVVHQASDLGRRNGRRRGIPVTTPQRMLVDLAAVCDLEDTTRAVEQLVASGRLSVATIRGELDRVARRGRRGVGRLRRVLDDWPLGGERPDSVLEVAFARLCKRAGLPVPVFQHTLVLGGRHRRIDFAYPDIRLAIEVDGFACRTDRRVFQDERCRQNDLIQAGWQVLRFTWHDIVHQPDHVAATIRASLQPALPGVTA